MELPEMYVQNSTNKLIPSSVVLNVKMALKIAFSTENESNEIVSEVRQCVGSKIIASTEQIKGTQKLIRKHQSVDRCQLRNYSFLSLS